MSSQYRRPRGTPKVALNLFVAPEVKELIDDYAARSTTRFWLNLLLACATVLILALGTYALFGMAYHV